MLGGQPIREPVVQHGPFVMNTGQELTEAFEDYQAGRMGQIPRLLSRTSARAARERGRRPRVSRAAKCGRANSVGLACRGSDT